MRYTTIQQCATAALMIQDATNLQGVASDFVEILNVLEQQAREHNKKKWWVDRHPIVVVYLLQLNKISNPYHHQTRGEIYGATDNELCEQIANGERPDLDEYFS